MELDTLSTFIKVGMKINTDFKIPRYKTLQTNNVINSLFFLIFFSQILNYLYKMDLRVMKLEFMKQINLLVLNIK